MKMTMRYTHIGIADQARAVGNLPAPKASPKPAKTAKPGKKAALQMRCISGGAGSPSLSPTGTTGSAKNGRKPLQSNGFGLNCRRLSLAGKAEGTGVEPATPFGAPHFQCQKKCLYRVPSES